MSAKRGMFIAPFDELFEPRLLAELAARAEAAASTASSSGTT